VIFGPDFDQRVLSLKIEKKFELTFKENSRNLFCGCIILTESTTRRFVLVRVCTVLNICCILRKDILNLIPTTTKKSELFFLSKNLELLSYIIVHCVQLILMCHFTVQFARPGENRRMLVDEIIFERWREFIKMALRTYSIHYSMIISIDQQHKPFESCWWQMKAHKRALKRHITENSKQIFPEKVL
jgi:hypothetical protein